MAQSKKDKGRYYELKTKKTLEAEGARVELAQPKIVWIKGKDGRMHPITIQNDFFGLFDGVAIFPDGRTLWFQVKHLGANSHGWIKKVRAEIAAFPAKTKVLVIWKSMSIGKRKFSECNCEVIL